MHLLKTWSWLTLYFLEKKSQASKWKWKKRELFWAVFEACITDTPKIRCWHSRNSLRGPVRTRVALTRVPRKDVFGTLWNMLRDIPKQWPLNTLQESPGNPHNLSQGIAKFFREEKAYIQEVPWRALLGSLKLFAGISLRSGSQEVSSRTLLISLLPMIILGCRVHKEDADGRSPFGTQRAKFARAEWKI